MDQRKECHRPSSLCRSGRPAQASLALASLTLSLGLCARVARAACVPPQPAIVWSYPAQGDTGVPTNVDLWVLSSDAIRPAVIRRDGVALAPLSIEHGYDAGELEPNTSYTFQVETYDYFRESTVTLELTFTTGAGPAATDPSAAPGEVVTSNSSDGMLSERCEAALWAQGCFDTGQDTYYRFTPTGNAKGWLLMRGTSLSSLAIWPGECGGPVLYSRSFVAPCATVYGIDATGALHPGEEVCAEAADPLPDPSDGNLEEAPATVAGTLPLSGEPATASNDTSASDTSRGSATFPAQTSSNGGCSFAHTIPVRQAGAPVAFGMALGFSFALLARRRRNRRVEASRG